MLLYAFQFSCIFRFTGMGIADWVVSLKPMDVWGGPAWVLQSFNSPNELAPQNMNLLDSLDLLDSSESLNSLDSLDSLDSPQHTVLINSRNSRKSI